MSTYTSYQTDGKLEREGIELDLGSAGLFHIARAGGANQRFSRRLEALMKPHRRAIQAGTLESGIAEKILRKVYVECVLLGWENVTGPDGEPLPYSAENAEKLFEDLPDLFRDIRSSAEDAALFRSVVREEDSGNS